MRLEDIDPLYIEFEAEPVQRLLKDSKHPQSPARLCEAFVWMNTPEGREYWHFVWTRLTRGFGLTPKAHEKLSRMMEMFG